MIFVKKELHQQYEQILKQMQRNMKEYLATTMACSNHLNVPNAQCNKCLTKAVDYIIDNAMVAYFILQNTDFLCDQINNAYRLVDATYKQALSHSCDHPCWIDDIKQYTHEMRSDYVNLVSDLLKNEYLNPKKFEFNTEQQW